MKKRLLFVLLFLFVLFGMTNFVFAEDSSSCTSAGYKCYDMTCPVGTSEVSSIKCPSLVGNRPEVCCKDSVDLSVQPKIALNRGEFQEGTVFEVGVELPYFSSCTYYYINSEGVEKQEGSGGCYNGQAFSSANIVARLKELFGSAEPGVYKIKIVAHKEGYNDITLIKEFKVVNSDNSNLDSRAITRSSCHLENGIGECKFLDKTYNIQWYGSKLTIAHDGIEEVFDNGVVNSFSTTLKDGIVLKVTGAPASVYIINLEFSKGGEQAPYLHINDEGTYLVKKDTMISVNDVEAKVEEISWALSGDTETRVTISSNNAQSCVLQEGEECKLFYGAVSAPISRNLIIKVNAIYRNEVNPSESTALINIKKINEPFKRIEPKEETGPIDVTNENKEDLSCNGCLSGNKCYPLGYRKGGKYCSENYNFTVQLESGQSCENSFQCTSNVCVSGECINEGLLKRFLDWFKRLFGYD